MSKACAALLIKDSYAWLLWERLICPQVRARATGLAERAAQKAQ